MNRKNLVVIGNGMAGARAVEEILSRGGADQFQITMFGDEPYGNYNRILLSNVLNGSQQESEIFLNPLSWYRENDILLHVGVRAETILRRSKVVLSDDGLAEPYDKLIIATGSSSYIPPIDELYAADGSYKPGLFVFRSLDDCREIAGYAQGRGKAVVIGGGLLGLEAARGLQNFGLEVEVVHRGGHLMGQQLDPQAGAILKTTMERMDVKVHLLKNTLEVLGAERVAGLRFADGSCMNCDMVVIATGISPNVQIAVRSGLTVERAIVVDNQMRAVDDHDIYVVGECAQHRGNVYGLVAPLWDQAKVLADHITGHKPDAAYHGSKVATKLKVMGVEMASMGVTEPEDERDEIVQFTEPRKGTYKKLVIRDGRLIGAILLGDISKAAYLTQAFDRNTPLPDDRLALLFDIGAPSKKVTLEELPLEAQICNCNGVSKGALIACVKSGKRNPKAVMEMTRAGMGCGSCKSMVSELIEWACGGEVEEDPSVHYYVPGVPLTKPDLIRACKERNLHSVSAVFRELAGGREDAASKPGLASLLNTIWAEEYDHERDARFINERVHANIQKDGRFSVVPQMPGGVTNPAQLRRIADVAEKYNVPMVKLTGGQRIDLLGIQKEDLPNIWRDLDMPSGHAYGKSYRTCKSCVGTDFCRFGVGDSTTLAIRIENYLKGIDSPGKLKMATAGCPRNCSEAMVKDVGAVAVEGGKWEIYVGGAAGAHVRKGDILCVVDSHDEVIKYISRFIQYYRENAKYLERTYGFVERVGMEKIRSIVVEDSEGIAAQLEANLHRSTAAYRDPWKEAVLSDSQREFSSLLPVLQ
ncbi:MAG TPA: nitrite reductase large subunit NirB [Bryobacteraceae bacterium]|jgi:nitrite reductase (NADH) large subunit|nr:nitrite reductase large subunit NirB [Bryobacteraceae bacterium]